MKRRRKQPRKRASRSTMRIPRPAVETFSLAGLAGIAAIEEGRKAIRRRRRRR
jgi:hypothetical protein